MTPLLPGLSTAESQIYELLRNGVSLERTVAIGIHRNTWTREDVWAIAGIAAPPEPEPVLELDTPYCATTRGYARHRRLREAPCLPCKLAHAEYTREWRRGRIS